MSKPDWADKFANQLPLKHGGHIEIRIAVAKALRKAKADGFREVAKSNVGQFREEYFDGDVVFGQTTFAEYLRSRADLIEDGKE